MYSSFQLSSSSSQHFPEVWHSRELLDGFSSKPHHHHHHPAALPLQETPPQRALFSSRLGLQLKTQHGNLLRLQRGFEGMV